MPAHAPDPPPVHRPGRGRPVGDPRRLCRALSRSRRQTAAAARRDRRTGCASWRRFRTSSTCSRPSGSRPTPKLPSFKRRRHGEEDVLGLRPGRVQGPHPRGRRRPGGGLCRSGQRLRPSARQRHPRLHPGERRGPASARASWSSTICSCWPGRCCVIPITGPAVRAALHERYDRLLLDEFQDTDPIQIELAVRIAAADPRGAAAGTERWDRGGGGARSPLRRGRPQAVDLPLPSGRHRHLLDGRPSGSGPKAAAWSS